ncbi:Erp3p PWA37_003532 [Arxiozyma heterogenica]|uniref:Erp3p n=1 Tax=Arxiozyma heterogenica TaxID=278026 RepID=UPI002EEB6F84
MLPALLILYLGAFITILVKASPITFILDKNKQECFYLLTPDTDCEITYYFSSTQDGTSEGITTNKPDLNYEIFAPDSRDVPIISKQNERKGQWGFVGKHRGEYSFCFKNPSLYDPIPVELELTYKCEKQSSLDKKRAIRRQEHKIEHPIEQISEQMYISLSDRLDSIERQLYMLEKNMKYYITRNDRNHYTVSSTVNRITMFSIYGILLIIGMSWCQIMILKWIFNRSRK